MTYEYHCDALGYSARDLEDIIEAWAGTPTEDLPDSVLLIIDHFGTVEAKRWTEQAKS